MAASRFAENRPSLTIQVAVPRRLFDLDQVRYNAVGGHAAISEFFGQILSYPQPTLGRARIPYAERKWIRVEASLGINN
ncbi:MAG: hypothetical protein NTY42_13825 [Planctomycetota bacterium]|nr:hypothetical protein [Planctomycetota bacterium]